MSGFDNEVMYSSGVRLEPSSAQDIFLMQKNVDDVSKINFTGDPNGNVSANPSSLCHDPVSGNIYLKASGIGDTGWVLIATGVGIQTINGDSGSIGGYNVTIFSNQATKNSGSSVYFTNAGATSTLNLTDSGDNTILGKNSGNLTPGYGYCVAVGKDCFPNVGPGTSNLIGVGWSALHSFIGDVGEVNNIAIGSLSLNQLTHGASNISIGVFSGMNYTTNESGNILLDNPGVVGDNGTIRIGNFFAHGRAFISGVKGVTIPGSAPVGIDANGQLSEISSSVVSAIPSGSAISLTTATNANVTSISLPAGKWAISGIVQYGGTPTVSGAQQASISDISATHGTLGNSSVQTVWNTASFVSGNVPITIPSYIQTFVATTTVYLVASGTFSGGTMTAYGRINAFRIA